VKKRVLKICGGQQTNNQDQRCTAWTQIIKILLIKVEMLTEV